MTKSKPKAKAPKPPKVNTLPFGFVSNELNAKYLAGENLKRPIGKPAMISTGVSAERSVDDYHLLISGRQWMSNPRALDNDEPSA